jgi:hypothetical protein
MNQITVRVKIGTIGELLVTLRLLQYGVQAAPPLKDSGNDLIAVRDMNFRAIQIKTTTRDNFGLYDLPERYHIVALVQLVQNHGVFNLEESRIFLLTKPQIDQQEVKNYLVANLEACELNQNLVDNLFGFENGEFVVDLVD